jgi:hypothetical protein
MPAWSFSALDAFMTCPRKYEAEKVSKTVKEAKNAMADYGSDAHKAFELFLFKDKPLPLDLRHHQSMLERFKQAPGEGFPEQKLALTAELKPTGFFDSDVWVRGIIDFAKVQGKNAVVVDWKFGKYKDGFDQIRLCTAILMAVMPEVENVVGAYYWAKEKRLTRTRIYRLDIPTIWGDFLPKVKRLESAFEKNDWPAKPSGLCRKYCGVTGCEFHGK